MIRTPPQSRSSSSPTANSNRDHDSLEDSLLGLSEQHNASIDIAQTLSTPEHQGILNQVADFLRSISLKTANIKAKLTEGKSLTKVNKNATIDICKSLESEAKTLLPGLLLFIRDQREEPQRERLGEPSSREEIKLSLDNSLDNLRSSLEIQIKNVETSVLQATRNLSDNLANIASQPQQSKRKQEEDNNPRATKTQSDSPSKFTPAPFKHALIISSKEDSDGSAGTLQAWRDSVSLLDTNFTPANIKFISNNKVRVEFDKQEHLQIALEKTESSGGRVLAEPAKSLQPMVIIKGIPKNIPRETLTDILVGQNDCLGRHQEGKDLSFKFALGNRNRDLYNAVFITTPATWRALTNLGHVNLNHHRIHVETILPSFSVINAYSLDTLPSAAPVN